DAHLGLRLREGPEQQWCGHVFDQFRSPRSETGLRPITFCRADDVIMDDAVALYRKLLQAWNDRDAAAFARLFSDDGSIVGFDGSTADNKADIQAHLQPIFADHPTAAYVGKVRAVQ